MLNLAECDGDGGPEQKYLARSRRLDVTVPFLFFLRSDFSVV